MDIDTNSVIYYIFQIF